MNEYLLYLGILGVGYLLRHFGIGSDLLAGLLPSPGPSTSPAASAPSKPPIVLPAVPVPPPAPLPTSNNLLVNGGQLVDLLAQKVHDELSKALSEAASNLVNVSRTPASKEPTAKP